MWIRSRTFLSDAVIAIIAEMLIIQTWPVLWTQCFNFSYDLGFLDQVFPFKGCCELYSEVNALSCAVTKCFRKSSGGCCVSVPLRARAGSIITNESLGFYQQLTHSSRGADKRDRCSCLLRLLRNRTPVLLQKRLSPVHSAHSCSKSGFDMMDEKMRYAIGDVQECERKLSTLLF